MEKVIFDCDNTMGVLNCDVDDGLTFLYLIGRKDIDLQGVTLTYGNNNIDVVFENTQKMIIDLNIKEIPILKGSQDKNNRISEASKFLAKKVKEYPKEITVLATGALTNLYGAYLYDNNFFKNVKKIILMGGITNDLIIKDVKINELNFSCDPEATHFILNSNADITVLNGHITMEAIFGPKELKVLENSKYKLFKYILEKINPWCERNEKIIGIKAFCNWDATTAIYLTNPEFFQKEKVTINSSIEDLKSGFLRIDEKGVTINMPSHIINLEAFNKILIDGFKDCNNKLF